MVNNDYSHISSGVKRPAALAPSGFDSQGGCGYYLTTQNMNFSYSTSRTGLAALLVIALAGRPAGAQTPPTRPDAPAPPAASSTPSTGPLSGYMDFHVNKDEGQDARVDFHRFVLLFNHSFSSRIRFVGELELEHAF